MTAITVGRATRTIPTASGRPKPGFFARAWKAFVRSRTQQAEREIALHRHLLPAQFESAAERLARGEKDLPFVR
ncbi:MAG: hypothetical protein ABWY35_09410 [Pseudorhodoplanes sp.]